MPYPETKVYFDGSHYIAIPHTTRPGLKRSYQPEEEIELSEEPSSSLSDAEPIECDVLPFEDNSADVSNIGIGNSTENHCEVTETSNQTKKKRTTTRKELFENLYDETRNLKRSERKKFILKNMAQYFKNMKSAKEYVDRQFERKLRNLICRRIRLTRKVNLQEFNYFCTFTYDGSKHTEAEFKSKLRSCFKMMCHRKKWKYVGVWERSPEKQRLHFHGLFYIPDGSMPGELIKVNDYSPVKKKMQYTLQNTYFNERFGRSDFKPVCDRSELGNAIAYLTKYMEKTGEKIVYSKGLPQFFITDIEDDDVVCTIGADDSKLLLFDNFICWDEGEYIGPVSKDTISKLRKSN